MRGQDWVGVFLSLAVIGLDQLTKRLVDHGMALHESVPVIPRVVNLTYVRNTGAAFGLFSDMGPLASAVLLSAFSLVAIGVLIAFWIKGRKAHWAFILSLALILGGAIGNLIDRVVMGEVIDFIDVYWRDLHWPAFNVADSAITVGVSLLLVHLLLHSRPSSSE